MALDADRPAGSRRVATVVGVCLLAVLAGCGAFGGDSGPDRQTFGAPERSDSPTAVQRTTASSDPFPPGVSESGSVDPSDLVSGHTAALEGRSLTVRDRVVQRFEGYGGVRYRSRETARYGIGGRYLDRRVGGQAVPVFGGKSGRVRFWSNGTAAVRAVTVGNETTYRGSAPTRATDRTGSDRLLTLFSTLEPELEERRVLNGTEEFVLRAERRVVPGDDPIRPTVAFSSLEDPRDIVFTARVTADGVVRSYNLSFLASVGNRTVRVIESRRFVEVGNTTVPRPPWVDRAIESVCSETEVPDWCGFVDRSETDTSSSVGVVPGRTTEADDRGRRGSTSANARE